MTELAICGMLEGELRSCGSESHPFEDNCRERERAALPHARSSSRAVAAGDLLLIDFGAVSNGSCSDITRTFVIGGSAEQREIHDVVRSMAEMPRLRVLLSGRDGGKDADALARGYIERRGLGEEIWIFAGARIGLEVHEAPRLSKAADSPLPVGAVVSQLSQGYTARIGAAWGLEDDVLLTTDGPRSAHVHFRVS